MYDFNYHRPASLDEAKKIIAENEEARFIAGGMTLLPTLKLRLSRPSDVVDLAGIEELHGIREEGDAVVIGAMTRHADVARSETVKKTIPALATLAESIGDAQVRNRGTIGGSIANSDPAADYPAAVLGLNATIRTDRREIAADDFFLGMFETALEEDEVVVAISFPKPRRASYAKFPNPASRYAIVGVMVAETAEGIRVAVTGAGASAFRATEYEAALSSSFSADALAGITIDAGELNSDLHASAEYRAHLVGVMAARAVKALSG